MNKNGADTSSVRNAEDLPDGWSWERFELVNAGEPRYLGPLEEQTSTSAGHVLE